MHKNTEANINCHNVDYFDGHLILVPNAEQIVEKFIQSWCASDLSVEL
jgi:hypothetical protein